LKSTLSSRLEATRGSDLMKYTSHIVDFFSSTPFGGNQLAVLPDAAGISTEGMQKIAREFSFGETTFILPKNDPANTCRVRLRTSSRSLWRGRSTCPHLPWRGGDPVRFLCGGRDDCRGFAFRQRMPGMRALAYRK